MTKYLFKIIIGIISIGLIIFVFQFAIPSCSKKVPVAIIPSTDTVATLHYIRTHTDQLPDYLHALSLIESDDNNGARRYGSEYIGKYQIGNSARAIIGLNKLNTEDNYQVMLNDTFLQDMIMLRLLQANVLEMKEYFTKYNGKKVGGWFVTTSGILAMTHLMGGGNTKAFLDRGVISRDGNNRPITDYLQLNNFNILVDSIASGAYIKNVLSKVKIK